MWTIAADDAEWVYFTIYHELCDMVYKRVKEPGLLAGTICQQFNGGQYKILHFMEMAMYDFYQLWT